jgi:hypothetical protein
MLTVQSACPSWGGHRPETSLSWQIGNAFHCDSPVLNCVKDNNLFYDVPLFAGHLPFQTTLSATTTSVSVSICVNQAVANEDIYITNLVLSVR